MPIDQLVDEHHPIAITEAPDNVPSTELRSLRSPDLTAITLVHGPDLDTPAQIAKGLLAALGKRGDVRGVLKSQSSETGLVTTWLTAHQTRLVTITASQHISTKILDALVDMVTPTAATLLLAVDKGYGDDLRHRTRHLAPVTIGWPRVPASADARTPESEEVDVARGGPWSLPPSGYWTFLADCHRQLTPQTYRQVHALYLDTYTRISTWINDLDSRGHELTTEQARDCLHGLIVEQPRFEAVQVAARAAQAAFHAHGWYLRVSDRDLRHGLIRFPPTQRDATLYNALRGLKAPARAAETALYMAGAPVNAISKVTIDDLARWRYNPTNLLANTEVPAAASPYLRAHLIHRMADGITPTDLAFPAPVRRIATDINQAAVDLGLNLGDANLVTAKATVDRRLAKDVIRLERLFTYE